ncbi:MAG: NUDIX hydrolase [Haliscomenobacter sp.]|uniref:NUDIX hydrolase n=1 Tax=Haliscomenobacter sp. TaxID=2717303 RepID=UPI0029BC48DD|nr:NUDIX hydrolase [Haliscomenobacter sp.]MDX2068448.1 NUDIX hydrolase [Haliscomenobacter sp.]
MINPSKQDLIPQITIDCVIFGYESRQLKVLIPKLDFNGDFWALPSGFVQQNDDIDIAAQKILQFRTGIENLYLEQFRVFGKVARNHAAFLDRLIELNSDRLSLGESSKEDYDWFTKRFIAIGYYALVDIGKVQPQKSSIDQTIEWHPVQELPTMILDHQEIVELALKTLRRDLDVKLNAFNLLPDTFTMKEVQEVYETISGEEFWRTNFQKKILDLDVLERLEKKFTGAANKAPYLYRFKYR